MGVVLDDNGNPIPSGGVVLDDEGNPITTKAAAAPAKGAPPKVPTPPPSFASDAATAGGSYAKGVWNNTLGPLASLAGSAITHPIDTASAMLKAKGKEFSEHPIRATYETLNPAAGLVRGLGESLYGGGKKAVEGYQQGDVGKMGEGAGDVTGILASLAAPSSSGVGLKAEGSVIPSVAKMSKTLSGATSAEALGESALAPRVGATATAETAAKTAAKQMSSTKEALGAEWADLSKGANRDLSSPQGVELLKQIRPALSKDLGAAVDEVAAQEKAFSQQFSGNVASSDVARMRQHFFNSPGYKEALGKLQQIPVSELKQAQNLLQQKLGVGTPLPPSKLAVAGLRDALDAEIRAGIDASTEGGGPLYDAWRAKYRQQVGDVGRARAGGQLMKKIQQNPNALLSRLNSVKAAKQLKDALMPDWADPALEPEGKAAWDQVVQHWRNKNLLGAVEPGQAVDLSKLSARLQKVGQPMLDAMGGDDAWMQNFRKLAESNKPGVLSKLPGITGKVGQALQLKPAIANMLLNSEAMTNSLAARAGGAAVPPVLSHAGARALTAVPALSQSQREQLFDYMLHNHDLAVGE